MRPPEFTGGNAGRTASRDAPPRSSIAASMRPPEFTGGNNCTSRHEPRTVVAGRCFNEAAGIHRRKLEFSPSGYRACSVISLLQ